MRKRGIVSALEILAVLLCVSGGRAANSLPVQNQQQGSGTDAAVKVRVYVSNFELDVAPLPPAQRLAAAVANAKPGTKIEQPPDPFKQASELVDMTASKLVAALQSAGYAARRLRPGEGRPAEGLQIRGLFAEVDSENHWRRAMIRTGVDKGKMEVVVAVGNLARPEQTLYEIAPLPGNKDKPGAVITLSPYVPLQKYDLDKNADDKAIANVAAQVVADLTALLSQNPAALPK